MSYLRSTLNNFLDIASESNGVKYEVEDHYSENSFTLDLKENGKNIWMVKVSKDNGIQYADKDEAYRLMIGNIVGQALKAMHPNET